MSVINNALSELAKGHSQQSEPVVKAHIQPIKAAQSISLGCW